MIFFPFLLINCFYSNGIKKEKTVKKLNFIKAKGGRDFFFTKELFNLGYLLILANNL